MTSKQNTITVSQCSAQNKQINSHYTFTAKGKGWLECYTITYIHMHLLAFPLTLLRVQHALEPDRETTCVKREKRSVMSPQRNKITRNPALQIAQRGDHFPLRGLTKGKIRADDIILGEMEFSPKAQHARAWAARLFSDRAEALSPPRPLPRPLTRGLGDRGCHHAAGSPTFSMETSPIIHRTASTCSCPLSISQHPQKRKKKKKTV